MSPSPGQASSASTVTAAVLVELFHVRTAPTVAVKIRVFMLSAYQVGFPVFHFLVTLDDHHEFVEATGF